MSPAIALNDPASLVLGQSNNYNTGTQGSSATGMAYPVDSAVDSFNHRLFVAEFSNNRVSVFQLNQADRPLDDKADWIIGQGAFGQSSTGLAANRLNNPNSIAFDPSGNRLFVTDTHNNRVLAFDVSNL